MNYYLVLLIAVVLNIVLGFLWYGPFFGPLWMKAMGWTPKDIARMKAEKKGMGPKEFAVIILGALAQAVVLAAVLSWYQPASWCAGALVGSLVWLGFAVPGAANAVIFEKRSVTLFRIDSLFWLVSMALMGAVISAALW